MALDVNWTRWIVASISVFFDQGRQNLAMYAEGAPRKTNNLQDWFELRMDGPTIWQATRNEFYGDVSVNALVRHVINDDKYAVYRNCGLLQFLMCGPIPVYKLGSALDMANDGTLIGCLQLQSQPRTHYYGLIEAKTPEEQMTVEGSFRISLS